MDFKGFSVELPAHLLDELEDVAAEVEEAADLITAVTQLADFIADTPCAPAEETLH